MAWNRTTNTHPCFPSPVVTLAPCRPAQAVIAHQGWIYEMYDRLTTAELAVLQDLFFSATEKSYQIANAIGEPVNRPSCYRSDPAKLASLFLEAGQELIGRLGPYGPPPASVGGPYAGRAR